jgi:hypothetical protein
MVVGLQATGSCLTRLEPLAAVFGAFALVSAVQAAMSIEWAANELAGFSGGNNCRVRNPYVDRDCCPIR